MNRLTRGPDGSFDDDAIADILQTATETPAGAYRARGHSAVFRVVEIMAIEQGRQWGVCTMNEFRRFLGLKPFATFEEWNSSVPGVAVSLRVIARARNWTLTESIGSSKAAIWAHR